MVYLLRRLSMSEVKSVGSISRVTAGSVMGRGQGARCDSLIMIYLTHRPSMSEVKSLDVSE